MSKIVHPYAHRLVMLRDWKSRWFADPKKYVAYLKGDVLIRQYLEKKLRGMYLSSIEIERSRKATRFIIKTSRPGLIRPSAETNSVQNTSGPPPASPCREYFTMMRRKAASVTSAIGARTKKGLGSFCQKFFIIYPEISVNIFIAVSYKIFH